MNDKFKKIKMASIFGMIGNLFLFLIKSSIGLLTNSHAMTIDAFNSISDVITSAITFIGNHISSKPSDADHNYGHGKAEYIYSLIISIVMFLLTTNLIYTSLKNLVIPKEYTYSPWLIVVCLLTITLKLLLYIYTAKIARKYDNLLISSNAIDHRNDCVLTTLNLISVLLASKGIFTLDSLVGLFIAVWIFASSFQIFKKSYDVLMDKAIDTKIEKHILDIVNSFEEVKSVDHFASSPIGYQYQISMTIYVKGTLSTVASYQIADRIKNFILSSVPEIRLTLIHVKPWKNDEIND